MPNPLPALLLLLTACAQAQPGVQVYQPSLLYDVPIIFENPEDSAAFARFREGMQLEEQPVGTGDNGTAKYRLVWEDRLQGGLRMVTRGDDEMMKDQAINITGFGPFLTSFRTADGRRGVMVTHEWPCALVCRVASYYVEE